ncbi:ABC transporter ATP-binding protein [Kitasatospora sp. NPDC059827]|uniref:ABC transporter ATP-binding protein n=1 Tax=Kitasatospora sp. NPDC059827 TaxID=3346964 RepID=UPI0036523678
MKEETDSSARGSLRVLLAYAKPHRWILLAVLALTLLGSAASLAQPLIVQNVLQSLGAGLGAGAGFWWLAGLLVTSVLFTWIQAWLAERTAERVVLSVRRALIWRLVRLRVPELDRAAPAELTSRVTSDSTLVQAGATGGLIQIVDGALGLIATLVLMGLLSPVLFAVTLAVLACIGLGIGIVLPRLRRTVTQAQDSVGAIGAALDRSLGAARTVKANGAEAVETRRATEAAERAYRAGLIGARYSATIAVLGQLAIQASFLAVIGVGGVMTATGSLDLATLIAFLLYLFNVGSPIISLITGTTTLQQGLGALVRVEQVEKMPIEEDVEVPVRSRLRTPPQVSVRNLTFGYAGRDTTLHDVSFVAPRNAQTAIVGPSGSGKTTLFSLMQRFYDPQTGAIHLDDTDMAGMTRAESRRDIAYVEQDAPMVDGTLEENLLYGTTDVTPAALARALRDTRLEDLVTRLPSGLRTPVGARGVTLSGGERQRLAIARALLRRPQVLLLDEATSNLDAQNEEALRTTLARVSTRCTILFIAHRMSTVLSADHVVVLDTGRVVGTGTHRELARSTPTYRRLVTTQLTGAPPTSLESA